MLFLSYLWVEIKPEMNRNLNFFKMKKLFPEYVSSSIGSCTRNRTGTPTAKNTDREKPNNPRLELYGIMKVDIKIHVRRAAGRGYSQFHSYICVFVYVFMYLFI